MNKKNDWNSLFNNIQNNILVLKGKAGNTILEIDALIALILCLVFSVMGLFLIIFIFTDFVYFEVKVKTTGDSTK